MGISDKPKSSQPGGKSKRWLLQQIPLFANLKNEQLDLIGGLSRIVEIEQGTVIYAQGDPADAFYCMISGRVRVSSKSPAGKEEPIEILHKGDFFGMTSLLTNEPHSVTTRTLNDSILLKIERAGFEQILKEVPDVAIYLSTTLSRRLRQKDVPVKRVFEATIISIYSPMPESGRTMYAINLAASLKKETGKRVILVDISTSGEEVCRALGVSRCPIPLKLKAVSFNHSKVDTAVVQHEGLGIDTLNVAHDPKVLSDETQIIPLLSYLANLYRFVIVDLPIQMDRTVFKALVQADLIHLLTDDRREALEVTSRLIKELDKTIQQATNRIKVITNEVSGHQLTPQQRTVILEERVYSSLPAVEEQPAPGHPVVLSHPDWKYAQTIRRIAREIGRVQIGLALGSGAALGLAHIGVLRVLEREKIPIDIIAGSSMGALLGVFWAYGMSADRIQEVAGEFNSPRSLLKLADIIIPKSGIFTGRRVSKFLSHNLKDATFRDLKIPVKVTAVDYRRRELVVLDEGSLVSAIRASVSIPAVFEPVKIYGRWMIDGGVLDPVPVDVLNEVGVHKVIAVNTLPSPENIHRKHSELAQEWERILKRVQHSRGLNLGFRFRQAWRAWVNPNIVDVIMHTMQAMEYELAEVGCAQADVVMHPTIPRVNWYEFYHFEQLIKRGEEEAEAHLAEIKKLVNE
ncbi:MAG: patatin-like phospholipase family protein [Candidatus Omnitrophica bacterium]|nr:patatin-like phospholipase family protein [Candidatus Omnitrophota bacterium]